MKRNFLVAFLAVIFGFDQLANAAKTPFSRVTRLTNLGGELSLSMDTSNKLHIFASDHYGTREVGLKSGYDRKDFGRLLRDINQNDPILCPFVASFAGGPDVDRLGDAFPTGLTVGTAARLVASGASLPAIAVSPLIYFLGKACTENRGLNIEASNTLQDGFSGLDKSIKVVLRLDSQNYWHLYDLIEDNTSLTMTSRFISGQGSGRRSTTVQ